MRLTIIFLLLLALAPPAGAQFQDLIDKGGRLALERDRPVTLTLRGVPAKEAVARLAEAAGVSLSCAPALEKRKVSLVCRERSARQVGEGLAYALTARWRKDRDGFVLEPADPAEALSSAELALEIGAAFALPGTQYGHGDGLPQPDLVGLLAETQLEAAATKEGLPFDQLLPEQRRRFLSQIMRELPGQLTGMAGCLEDLARLDGARVTLGKQESVVSASGGTAQEAKKVVSEHLVVGTGYTLRLGGTEAK